MWWSSPGDREREGESEREKKNKSVHYQTRNTRQWVKVINVDVQGRTKGGKDTTRFHINGCSRSIKGTRTTMRKKDNSLTPSLSHFVTEVDIFILWSSLYVWYREWKCLATTLSSFLRRTWRFPLASRVSSRRSFFSSLVLTPYIYIYVYVCMCIRMYVCMYVCMYIRIHPHTYTHTYMVAENDLLQGGPDLLGTCRRHQTLMRRLHEFMKDPGHGLVTVFVAGSRQCCG